MTTMANGSAPSATNSEGTMQFKFLAHVQSLPVVHDSIDQLYSTPLGRNAGDALKVVSQSAFKLSGPINPLLAKADSYADSSLKNIENRFPIVKASTSEIKDKTSGVAKTTVGTYVGAAKDTWQGATSNGHAAGEKIRAQTDGVVSQVHGTIDPYLKPVVDTVEDLLDTYLPKAKSAAKDVKSDSKSAAKDAKSQAKDIADDDKVQEAKKEAEHQAQRIYELSLSMFDRSKEGVRSRVEYVKDTATWSLNHPREVPSAAINAARERSQYVADTIDSTVQTTRKRAASITDIAFQARDKALTVFQEEQKAAPKDFPRGLVVSSINTALRLSKETLDHARNYLQQHTSTDTQQKAEDVADKADEKSQQAKKEVKGASEKVNENANHVANKASEKADEAQSTPAVKKARKAINNTADTIANAAK